MTRNPRDTCLSFLNHFRVLEGYTGSKDLFIDAFLGDVCGYYTPFIGHVLGYWELSKSGYDNVLFLTYEEMKRDLATVVTRVAKFLDKEVPEGDRMAALLEHLSFDKMKKNDAVNKSDMVEVKMQYQSKF